jgi:hypothetical protein
MEMVLRLLRKFRWSMSFNFFFAGPMAACKRTDQIGSEQHIPGNSECNSRQATRLRARGVSG